MNEDYGDLAETLRGWWKLAIPVAVLIVFLSVMTAVESGKYGDIIAFAAGALVCILFVAVVRIRQRLRQGAAMRNVPRDGRQASA